jgi:hypothetical protein
MPAATTPQTHQETGMNYSHVLIRRATSADDGTIRRLAALDSARVPRGSVLIAQVNDEPRAAIEVGTGTVISDPFRPTGDLAELLTVHARSA